VVALSATVNNQASADQGNIVSMASYKQKQTNTSAGVDTLYYTFGSSWGTPFNPNPTPKDPSIHDHYPPMAIDLVALDSSSGQPCPPTDKLFKYTFLDISVELIDNCRGKENPSTGIMKSTCTFIT